MTVARGGGQAYRMPPETPPARKIPWVKLAVVAVVLIVGALSFIPALALGPIVEHLMMIGQ